MFVSDADGLSPDAKPVFQNVYLRDRQTGTTTLVSRSTGANGLGANADPTDPAITVDGSGHPLVAFGPPQPT